VTGTATRGAAWAARLHGPLAAAGVVLAGFALVAVVDPNEPGHYPTCPFLALTGLYCPGCGSLRAAHALTRGDVATSAGDNILFTLGLPLAVLLWGRWLYVRAKGRPAPVLPAPGTRPALWVAGLAVLVLFGVVRNLPWGAFLAP